MSNAIVDLKFTLDLPEAVVERIAGSDDDGSQRWHEEAWEAVERAVADDPSRFMDYANPAPDVEVTM